MMGLIGMFRMDFAKQYGIIESILINSLSEKVYLNHAYKQNFQGNKSWVINPFIQEQEFIIYKDLIKARINLISKGIMEYRIVGDTEYWTFTEEWYPYEEFKEIKNMKKPVKGFLYAILFEDGIVKIGITKNFELRIKSLKTGTGRNILKSICSVPRENYREIEFDLHEYFKTYKTQGEFYKVDFTLVEQEFMKLKLLEAA